MGRVPAVNASPFRVLRVDAALLDAAASRLVARANPPRADAGRLFLESARRHRIDLTNMWVSVSGDQSAAIRSVRQVALAVPGAGRTAMFFTTTPAPGPECAELSEVVLAAGGAAGERLGQALLEPDETTIAESLTLAGFTRLADLAYLRMTLPSQRAASQTAPAPLELPPGVEATTWRAGDEEDLIAALDRSYIDTLDCPELCALRTTRDTYESHRATGGAGAFDPGLWWIVRVNGAPEGALLLSPCPEQGHVELVYLGLSPVLRGRGVATALLRHGLDTLARRTRPERMVTCAVDQRNAPAKRLYASAGFREFAARSAYVRRLP